MKKLLLSLIGCAVALSGMALDYQLKPAKRTQGNPAQFKSRVVTDFKPLVITPSRASESILFSPAGQPYNAVQFTGLKEGMVEALAMEFTADDATRFAGNKVTGITFFTGIDTMSTDKKAFQSLKSAQVFMTDDLEKQPTFTKTITLDETAIKQIKVALDEPLTIETGKNFYVGVLYTLTTLSTNPIIIDGMMHDSDAGGWAGIGNAGAAFTDLQWMNFYDQVGFNCIGVSIEGETMPKNNVDILGTDLQVVAEAGKTFSAAFGFINNGVNPVQTLTVVAQVGDEEPMSGDVNVGGLPYNMSATCELPFTATTVGDNVPVKIAVTKVNGEDNTGLKTTAASSIEIIPAGSGFQRRVLFEEYTGTWCGWCPRGIVATEYLRENYKNELIPVAIHKGDAMESSYFTQLGNIFNPGGSAPYGVMDRMYEADPGLDALLEMYDFVGNIPSRANLECEAHISGDTIYVSAKTQFYKDMDNADKNFILTFSVTQDEVGPYTQTNYYNNEFQIEQTGSVQMELEGWNDRPYQAEGIIYNDVARYLEKTRGVSGSIPANVKAGETYTFDHKWRWRAMKKGGKYNLVASIMNPTTYAVENSWFVQMYNDNTGVEDIVVEDANNAPVEFYNLQGVRVANPENGIYIRRQGDKASKVIIR